MERINLELSQSDVNLILKTMENAYEKSLNDVWVDPRWVKNDDGGYNMEYGHWEHVETKESKSLKSTIDYIKNQIK